MPICFATQFISESTTWPLKGFSQLHMSYLESACRATVLLPRIWLFDHCEKEHDDVGHFGKIFLYYWQLVLCHQLLQKTCVHHGEGKNKRKKKSVQSIAIMHFYSKLNKIHVFLKKGKDWWILWTDFKVNKKWWLWYPFSPLTEASEKKGLQGR